MFQFRDVNFIKMAKIEDPEPKLRILIYKLNHIQLIMYSQLQRKNTHAHVLIRYTKNSSTRTKMPSKLEVTLSCWTVLLVLYFTLPLRREGLNSARALGRLLRTCNSGTIRATKTQFTALESCYYVKCMLQKVALCR